MAAKRRISENDDGAAEKKKRKGMERAVKKRCMEILVDLMNHPVASNFSKLVVESANPDYSRIIKCPMDLSRVKQLLEKGCYSAEDDFVADVRLVFANAKRHNRTGTKIHVFARKLDELFLKMWESKASIVKKHGDNGSSNMQCSTFGDGGKSFDSDHSSLDSTNKQSNPAPKEGFILKKGNCVNMSKMEISDSHKDMAEKSRKSSPVAVASIDANLIPIPPNRAHRVAALTKRYVNLIFKATQQISGGMKPEEQKEKVKAKFHDDIGAMEEALWMKLVEKSRAASREAIEKMKQTFQFDESTKACEEMMMLCRKWSQDGRRSSSRFISLEALGLYLKQDNEDDIEEGELSVLPTSSPRKQDKGSDHDLEEGEILCC